MSMQEHELTRKRYRFRRMLLLTAAISVAVLIFVVAQIPSGSVQKNTAFSLIGQRAPAYPSGPDNSGSIAQTYLVTNGGVPETIFVNRRRVIISKYIGAIDQATLDQAIAAAST